MKNCNNCCYWDRAEGSDIGEIKMGLCRVNPPVIVDGGVSRAYVDGRWVSYSREPVATWPLTESEDWCGMLMDQKETGTD